MADAGKNRMPTISRAHVARLAAEFIVIFASVVLALVADDWRVSHTEFAEFTGDSAAPNYAASPGSIK